MWYEFSKKKYQSIYKANLESHQNVEKPNAMKHDNLSTLKRIIIVLIHIQSFLISVHLHSCD